MQLRVKYKKMITKISLCNIQLFVQDDLTRLNIFKNEKKYLKKER